MRKVAVGLTVALALALLVPTAGAAFGGLAQQSVDADVVVMNADVAENGDAQWRIDYRIRLADDNDTQAFEELATDIDSNGAAYTTRFRDQMNTTARAGENATGREMAIENVSVATRQESFGQTYGVVTYRFRWTNFAAVEGDRLVVGDALGGLFLDRDVSLTVAWPAGYQADEVTPQPDEESGDSVTWRGQRTFDTDEPRVVLGQGDSGQSVPGPVAIGLLALLVAAAGVGYWRYTDSPDEASEPATGAAAAAGTVDTGEDGESAPPADLLSNEEQVLQLLEDNGGRMKQQQVAGDLDWTDAKTSQVISGLREDDAVETFRIGRENVVTLPDTDVTGETADGSEDE